MTLNDSYGMHVNYTGTFSERGPWPGVWEEETLFLDSAKLGNILLTSQTASFRISYNSNICVWLVKCYIYIIYTRCGNKETGFML